MNGQTLNRFAYVNGNPVSYIDPTGLARDSSGGSKGWGTSILDGFQTALDVAGLVPGFGEVADGANALIYLGRGDTVNASLSGVAMIPFLGWGGTAGKFVNKGLKYGDEVVEGSQAITKASNDVIHVTPDGVALPKGRNIPSDLVENPYRSGSYGKTNPNTGKFEETLRIDPATPKGKKGPDYSHYHLDGGSEHYSPRPGDNDPWIW